MYKGKYFITIEACSLLLNENVVPMVIKTITDIVQ